MDNDLLIISSAEESAIAVIKGDAEDVAMMLPIHDRRFKLLCSPDGLVHGPQHDATVISA
jgi:hypothetical protein